MGSISDKRDEHLEVEGRVGQTRVSPIQGESSISLTHEVEYRMPTMPNFLRCKEGGGTLYIAYLTEDQAEQVANLMGNAFMAHYKKRRKNATTNV